MTPILVALIVLGQAAVATGPPLDGPARVWHPLTLTFDGPQASAADSSPNPFLDYRLEVRFTGPSGQKYLVPGFFDGDGAGGQTGRAWRARFSPDQAGRWTYEATLRAGSKVAVQLDREAGVRAPLPGNVGEIQVAPRDPEAPGFLKWGRLRYVGKPYLKFVDGPYWLRGGTDEPEDFLGYAGFVRTPPKHHFTAHCPDWRTGDPDWDDGAGRGIIGALNSLADQHVNSLYFLTMNVGGDGKDVWPWLGPIDPRGAPSDDNLHFDMAKLRQWDVVFSHAQRLGIALHVVLNEAEAANKRELDDGELGTERKLYYRELIARFGHHLAMQWNLCEEYNIGFDFGPGRIRAFADYLRAVDPYGHPITVHSAGDPVEALRFTYGDPRFSTTSIQLNQRPIHEVTEAIRRATITAGRPLPTSLDEFTLDRGQRASHIPVDDAEGHRREKIWPTYFSGGMIEFILEGLLKAENFKTPEREKLWQYLWYARKFMESELPFWEMEPADDLVTGGATIAVGIGKGKTVPLGPQTLARRGDVYAVYLPSASPDATLDLSDLAGGATRRWYNPRTGAFVGPTIAVAGGGRRKLGAPPADPGQDWVVLVRKAPAETRVTIPVTGFRDGAHHWRTIRDDGRVIRAEPDQPVFAPEQVREIVGNLLRFQRSNGGWPKDYDMLAILTPGQINAVRATRHKKDTSFDNHNIHSQVDYLARALAQGREEAWRVACLRGLDFMLDAQLPDGGFPQRFPDPKGYSAHITFNDGVMIGILNVLKDAADGEPHWSWLDPERRRRAGLAVGRGIACILRCQIRVDGVRTGWCQQHDERTFEAAPARTFELASICPQETTEICRFLMRSPHPSPDVVAAIDAAAAWLTSASLSGIRVEKVPAAAVDFPRHRADFDVVVRADPGAKPIWARHYEIGTNRPIFAGRDAARRYALGEIERERRTGTAWYGSWPTRLLEREYPRWRKSVPRE